jgi:GDPmannose 4,6-dehydratase
MKALIIGANGQDASYLAELLNEKGYEIHGTIRRNSVPESQTSRIEALHKSKSIKLHYADLTDPISIETVIKDVQADEIYLVGRHLPSNFLQSYLVQTYCVFYIFSFVV